MSGKRPRCRLTSDGWMDNIRRYENIWHRRPNYGRQGDVVKDGGNVQHYASVQDPRWKDVESGHSFQSKPCHGAICVASRSFSFAIAVACGWLEL